MPRYCDNCGKSATYDKVLPIDAELQRTWSLSNKLTALFNLREGRLCTSCGANIRSQGLARAITRSKYGYGQKSLAAWVKVANQNKLSVCELNSCQRLHDTLKGLNNLTYSEFGTPTQQNIEALTYPDNSFDLVLHSETLEHVPNPRQAMDECRRVIKKDGVILFTTPVIWSRQSLKRAKIQGKKIVHRLEPSYHAQRTDDYLVFQEYGKDIDSLLGVGVAYADWRHQNYVFVSFKQPTTISRLTKLKLKMLQYLAIYIMPVKA